MSALAIAAVLATGTVVVTEAQDRTIGERIDDAAISASIKTKLAADRAKNLLSVNVDTREGVVHLKGAVPTERDRSEAERLARGTKGVRGVQNDLVVTEGAASPRTR
jgi:osmotically-inducible protein OsmY